MRALFVASAAVLAVLGSAGAALAADVVVQVTGVQARGGDLLASLQTRDQFMRGPGTARAMAHVDGAGTVTLIFKDVPPGEYAVSVMHDQNGDRQMNLAPSGLPAEGVASSNGANLHGFPQFDDAKITVTASGASTTAPMLYMDGKIPGR